MLLKHKYGYTNLKIYVAGSNIIDTSSLMKKIRMTGYAKYLISLIKKLENDIYELSEAGWRMDDFHDRNLLIDSRLSTITAIDTDCYIKVKNNPYKENLKTIFFTIIYVIIPKIQLSKAYRNKLIRKYYIMGQEGMIKTSEFLELLLLELKQYLVKDLTIEGLRKKL